MESFIGIQKKWQKKWADAKTFEANAIENKPKFFVTFPYPYINAFPHIGHFYTMMRVEAFARYKKMKGYNVLYPQGWHCTGSPIVSAAKRIKEKEEKQWKIMRDQGFSDNEILKFSEPVQWVKTFAPIWKRDLKAQGLMIDWRRNFTTSSLNPYYDKFIRWQFSKLKEKNYIIKGNFPVVWCTKCKNAVSDHSRSEGEGETAQEFTLLKFKLEDGAYLLTATLRPETIYGQTNLWVEPDNNYAKIKVKDEEWIVSEECVEKLKEQNWEVKFIENINGKALIGKYAKAPGIGRKIIILPSYFCDTSKGTGIVTSVPSDAPDDYIGLHDLQNDEDECKKYGLDIEQLKKIKIIPIIDSKDLGDMPAVKICKEMGIKNQHERKKLTEAKKIVYKKGFYEGTLNKNCGKYAGKKVIDVKDEVKKALLESGEAIKFYELSGKVVCRCLTPSIIKIVSNQWFIDYGNKEWKKLAHECLKQIKLYPKNVRAQFEYVIDWLHEWACTREEGLGTRLPWDEKWLIESLSDSTIYPAYYTIAHLIKDVPIEKINNEFFDYVFYSKGEKPDVQNIDEIRKEFMYWFPCDFRNSGKDLIQNHLTFYIFNHVAIFPKNQWPKGIGANGWLTVDGQKMSKSLGNMIALQKMAEEFGSDASRITILNGGEGLDDPNWDTSFAKSIYPKLQQIGTIIDDYYNKGVDDFRKIDGWLESRINCIIKEVTELMDSTLFRSAIQKAYFEFSRAIKWYLRRVKNKPNNKLLNSALETQLLMLTPFTPHICEEIWSKLNKRGFISNAEWPNYEEKKIDERKEYSEIFVNNVMTDIIQVKKLAKLDKIKKITFFISEDWKFFFFERLKKEFKKTRNIGELIKIFIESDNGKIISKMIPMLVKNPQRLPHIISNQTEEEEILKENKIFLKEEFDCNIEIITADKSDNTKSKKALPGKPAIILS
ncbi:MAG: leucine--tRNA ligase [Nanoarchaeota archaeon]|nr:leucine--tRNA ligase [Nanoarchaeota archaeon]